MKRVVEKVINVAYCVGASIVIFGALSKIVHKSYADVFLTVGLLTECALFLCMGYQEWFTPPQHTTTAATAQGNNDEVVKEIRATNAILNRIYK